MFEKLLLAGTITFSLNLFIGMSVHSPSQPTVTAQSTPAQATPAQATPTQATPTQATSVQATSVQAKTTQPTRQSVYLAKALHDSPLLRSLFQ